MKLSIIIPCYNESANLPKLLERCQALTQLAEVEIILVDNGSTDGTAEFLKSNLPKHPQLRSIRVEKNCGYGFGILSGLRDAQGDVLAWTHADLQTDPQDILKGYSFFKNHGENIFVKGCRKGRPISDVFFTIGMSLFETLLLKTPLWDINAQPNLFSRTFFNSWKNPPHDFSLDLYAYYEARRQNLGIFRFPVLFKRRLHGSSHWNINWAAKRKFISRTIKFSLELRKTL